MHTNRRLAGSILASALTLLGIFLLAGCDGDGSGRGDFFGGNAVPSPAAAPAALSGSLTAGEGQILDGDTRDPFDPAIANFPEGQPVAVPATIGGLVDIQGDEWDLYRVNLQGPTTMMLNVADPAAGDVDLYFARTDGTIIKGSLGTGLLEIVQNDPEHLGEFLVAVHAFDGGSNYLLSIGVNAASAATVSSLLQEEAFLDPAADFVAEEVVAAFREESREGMQLQPFSEEAFPPGLLQTAASPNGARLLKIAEEAPLATGLAVRRSASPLRYGTAEEESKARTLAVVKELRRRSDTVYAEPNYIHRSLAIPNDPIFAAQWHYQMINLPQAWDITTGSDEVVVAVIDSGVVYTHPDLIDRLLRDGAGNIVGFDFISDPGRARDMDGIDPDPFDVGDLAHGQGSSFHGTHVAGTIAAASNNTIGVAGATWQGKIMPLRVLGLGGGTDFDIVQAILYAAGAPNASGAVPPVRADIINLSIGLSNVACGPFPPLPESWRAALETALAAGVIVVAAAGNEECNVPVPLSTVPGVISVSAVDRTGQLAWYSNSGPTVSLAAPGGDLAADLDGDGLPDGVLSTLADDTGGEFRANYAVYQGTSMAAPHVAGVLALMLSVNPALTPADIHGLIAGTHPDPNAGPITRDLGPPGRDDLFGHGLIDAFLAVQQARGIVSIGSGGAPAQTDTPVLAVAPESLNFGAETTSLQILISNPSVAELEVTAIAADGPWIAIDTAAYPTIRVSVDRSTLPVGTTLGSIAIRSTGGSKVIPVFVRVEEGAAGGDVGTAYVLALDPATLETVAQGITGKNQDYRFEIETLPPGEYFIVAGSDRDNNGFICESAEACGLFPLLNEPVLVDLENRLEDVDFSVSYFFAIAAENRMAASGKPLTGFRRLDTDKEPQ